VTVDDWLAELVGMRRQQRHFQDRLEGTVGIRNLYWRAWLDRYQRGERTSRPRECARAVRQMTPRARLEMHEGPLPPDTKLLRMGRNSWYVQYGRWPGDRQARVTGVY